MGRQHAGCRRVAVAKSRNALQNLTQRIRRTGDRGWAKRRHAILRQPLSERRDRVAAVQRVDALDPVHVNVDETRHDDVAAQICSMLAGHAVAPVTRPSRRTLHRSNVSDPIAVDDERALLLNSPGQHEIGARQDDHER